MEPGELGASMGEKKIPLIRVRMMDKKDRAKTYIVISRITKASKVRDISLRLI